MRKNRMLLMKLDASGNNSNNNSGSSNNPNAIGSSGASDNVRDEDQRHEGDEDDREEGKNNKRGKIASYLIMLVVALISLAVIRSVVKRTRWYKNRIAASGHVTAAATGGAGVGAGLHSSSSSISSTTIMNAPDGKGKMVRYSDDTWQEIHSLVPSDHSRAVLPWRLRVHDAVRKSFGNHPLVRSHSRICRTPSLNVQVDNPFRSETATGHIKRSYVSLRASQGRGQEMEELWNRRYSKKYDTFAATFLLTDTTALNRLKKDDPEQFEQIMKHREGETYIGALDGADAISGNKAKQLQVKRDYAESFGCDYNDLRIQPAQFTMHHSKECKSFFRFAARQDVDGNMWIMKPILGQGGVGITLHSGIADFEMFRACPKSSSLKKSLVALATTSKKTEEEEEPVEDESDLPKKYRLEDEEGAKKNNKFIIQQYIKFPLLIHGKKFDMRVYMFIASAMPYFVFYHQGYLRRAIVNYDATSNAKTVFLTNTHYQSLEKKFELADHIWGWPRFSKYLADNNVAGAHYVSTVLDSAIKKVLLFNFMSAREELVRRKGSFHLFGLDFMIDDQLRVHFIEANGYPGFTWSKDFPTRTLVTTMFDMILELHEAPTAFEKMTVGDMYGAFELIYNELEDGCSEKMYNPCVEFASHNTNLMKERAAHVANLHDAARRTISKAKKQKEYDAAQALLSCKKANLAPNSAECQHLLRREREAKFAVIFEEMEHWELLNAFVAGM